MRDCLPGMVGWEGESFPREMIRILENRSRLALAWPGRRWNNSLSKCKLELKHSTGCPTRDRILRHQFDKILEYFAPCYSQFLTGRFYRNHKLLWFKNEDQVAKQENSSIVMTRILQNQKTRVKTRQKLESVKIRVYAQKPQLKMPFKTSSLEHGQLTSTIPFWWLNIQFPVFFIDQDRL